MKYDAFISYRHAPLDMEIAKKVHTGLETYKIPKAVRKKTGKVKMGRVFRDQEELPIGSDLGDNISGALATSEYLIVICSPRTPGSYWVCKEIDTFIKMHDRDHILAVLIEGEPDESFPPQLLTDENGEPVEPLAADVRGADRKERNKRFRTEILRLAAPVIGCTYDDLKQRHRERLIKRIVASVSAAALVIAAAGTAFGIYNANVADRMKQLADEKAALADEKAALADEKTALADEKTRLADEITVQYQGKLENQSRFYAEEAMTLFEQGNREDAALVVLEALPSDGNDRPYVPEAEYALSRALYAYESGDTISVDRNLTHDLNISSIVRTEDGKKLVVSDSGSKVYVWDTETWSLLTTIEPSVDELNYYEQVKGADADDSGVYIATDKRIYKYGLDGRLIFFRDVDDTVMNCMMCKKTGKLYAVMFNSAAAIDPSDGRILHTYENTTGVSNNSKCKYDPESGTFAFAHNGVDGGKAYITLIDTRDDTSRDVQLSARSFQDMCFTPNGNCAVLSCQQDTMGDHFEYAAIDLVNKNGDIKWSRKLDASITYAFTYVSLIKSHKYTVLDSERCDIVVTIESEAFTLDEENGSIRATLDLPGGVSFLALSVSNSYGRVGYDHGNIDVVDFAEGKIYSDYAVETADSIKDGVAINTQIVYTSYRSPDIHVLSWHEAPDLEDHAKLDEKMVPYTTAKGGSYYVMHPSDRLDRMEFFDEKGKSIFSFDNGGNIWKHRFYEDKACVLDRYDLTVIDPFGKKTDRIKLEDIDPDMQYSCDVYFSDDGDSCVLWYGKNMWVLDIKNRKLKARFDLEERIANVVMSTDANTLYVLEGDENLYTLDIATGDRTEFADDRLRIVGGDTDNEKLAISGDGRYIALCCMDGYARVMDTASLETYAEIPLRTYTSSFIGFTDDGDHLVLQGDDLKIRTWDMKDMSFCNTISANSAVTDIICDGDSPLMAVCTGTGIYLYETQSYGCVGYAPSGIIYLEKDDTILLCDDKTTIKRCRYKDIKKLAGEVAKQFPDASLSDEKRAMYNIN